MRYRTVLLVLGLMLFTLASPAADPKKPGARDTTDPNDVSLEIEALQLLYQLDLTPRQLQALAKIAPDTAAPARERKPAKVSAAVRQSMLELRAALRKNDADRIDELTDKLDELKEKENPPLDDSVEVTAGARKRAPDALRLLSPKQVTDYLNIHDELPDPMASVREALKNGLKLQNKDWNSVRDDAAEEVATLVAGFDADKAKKVAEQTAALLDKAHAWKEDELKKRQEELDAAVQEIMGDIGPVDVLRNIVLRDLAEVLSNPQLTAAIEARLKEGK